MVRCLVLLLAVASSACRLDLFVSAAGPTPLSPAAQTITLGQIVTSSISAGDLLCATDFGLRPCRRFRLLIPQKATIFVRVTWHSRTNLLLLSVRDRTGCCFSPLISSCDVTADSVLEVIVALREGDSQTFQIEASLGD
jgi:hypothetical protein